VKPWPQLCSRRVRRLEVDAELLLDSSINWNKMMVIVSLMINEVWFVRTNALYLAARWI
jgi:hypothetical protein